MAKTKKAVAKTAKATKAKAPARRSKKSKEEVMADNEEFFDIGSMLDELQDDTEKKYGLASSALERSSDRMSTGLLSLDVLLYGGIQPGGWYTVYGPEQSAKSTLAMTMLAQALDQRVTKNSKFACGIFDYEGSVDEEYTGNIIKSLGMKGNVHQIFGVRDDEGGWEIPPIARYYSHDVGDDFFKALGKIKRGLPDKQTINGKPFYLFEHTKANKSKFAGMYDTKYLSKNNKIKVPAPDGFMQGLYLCDSYPAMLPDGLDDDDRNDAMAEQARMFSAGIKKVKGGMRKKAMTVIGINQLRLRPATMFGCLHASTKVPFVDGRVHTMKEIVENKISGDIWSFNEKTQEIEPRPIIDWHYNGDVTDKSHWMKIVTRCPETGNGQAFVICTPNHEILTDNGWKRADEVQHTDRLVSKYTSVRTGTVASFLNGIASGDSSIVRPVYVDIISIEAGSDRAFRQKGKYDISVDSNHNYMVGNSANGFIVHNSPEYEPCGEALKFFSDVRIKSTPRANGPSGFTTDKGIVTESSATSRGKDTYRFVRLKTTKNKLGGIPQQECWARIWVSDSTGTARGFDPAFDTFEYLSIMGYITGGTKNGYKFHEDCPLHGAKKLSWEVFKKLVNCPPKEIKAICEEQGIRPVKIRDWCRKHCSSGKGPKRFKELLVAAAESASDDDD